MCTAGVNKCICFCFCFKSVEVMVEMVALTRIMVALFALAVAEIFELYDGSDLGLTTHTFP